MVRRPESHVDPDGVEKHVKTRALRAFSLKNEASSSSGTQRACLLLRWHEGVVTLPPATGVVIAVSVEVCGDQGCRWHYVGRSASHGQITPVGRSLWRLRRVARCSSAWKRWLVGLVRCFSRDQTVSPVGTAGRPETCGLSSCVVVFERFSRVFPSSSRPLVGTCVAARDGLHSDGPIRHAGLASPKW